MFTLKLFVMHFVSFFSLLYSGIFGKKTIRNPIYSLYVSYRDRKYMSKKLPLFDLNTIEFF